MSKKEKQVAKALRDLANAIDPPLDQVGRPPKPETSEAAQAKYEAVLAAFNTKGGRSLNSATPHATLEDLLKEQSGK
jgi:hypothetical protein